MLRTYLSGAASQWERRKELTTFCPPKSSPLKV